MPAQKDTTQTPPNIDIGNPYTPRRPAPLISISVNHPIAKAARKIKNFLVHKQTLFATTFSIKVTPIVAMVSLFGVAALFGGGITTAYNFGKTMEQKFIATQPTPTPKIVVVAPVITTISKAGVIKATYQLQPTPTVILGSGATPESNQSSDSGQARMTTPTPTPQPVLHYIFVSGATLHYLTPSTTVHFQNYLNLRVLITGSFDSSKNTLTIAKPEDIEILQ